MKTPSKGGPCPGACGGRHPTCSLGEPFAGRAVQRGLGLVDSKAWCSPPRTESGQATKDVREDFRLGARLCVRARLLGRGLSTGASPRRRVALRHLGKPGVRGPENRGMCPRVVLCCRNLQAASDGEAGVGESHIGTEPSSPEREPRVKSAGRRMGCRAKARCPVRRRPRGSCEVEGVLARESARCLHGDASGSGLGGAGGRVDKDSSTGEATGRQRCGRRLR